MSCLNCNKDTKNPKFCCSSCSASYNNKNAQWRKKYGILKEEKTCLQCGKICLNKFCSSNCHRLHEMREKIDKGLASSKTIKKFLLKIYGNKCFECGINEWNNKPIVVELEHKNGNSSDNSLNNCCLLCPNCHSQTDTYKGKNKGNGRHFRKLRYQEGKSY